jgi:DNA processing protein
MSRLIFAQVIARSGEFVDRLGPAFQVKIFRSFESAKALLSATPDAFESLGGARIAAIGLQQYVQSQGLDDLEENAVRFIDYHENNEIHVAAIDDDDYPHILSEAADAPLLLYWRGSLSGLEVASAAVVGTRSPTEIGLEICDRVTSFLAGKGVGIVSGLALGIDTVAHKSALTANGYTAAVLAQSLKRGQVAPGSNLALSEAILEAGGALISEHPLGAITDRFEFARRDRIQSGLSRVVSPIQTDVKGGTQNTIAAAKKQGRKIWVPEVQAEVSQDKWNGIRELIDKKLASPFSAANYQEILSDASTDHVAAPNLGLFP